MVDMLANLVVLACCLGATLAQGQEGKISTSPPYFITQPPQLFVYRIGEKAVLQCEAMGQPPPTYTWTKNRLSYNPGEVENRAFLTKNSGTLNILDTKDLDAGEYQCTATNSFGSAVSEKCFLRPAILDKFDRETTKQTFSTPEGRELTLPCTPPTSYPLGTFYWSVTDKRGNSQSVRYSPRVVLDLEGKLHFVNTRMDDASTRTSNVVREPTDWYTCSVHNLVLRKVSYGALSVVDVSSVGANIPQRPIGELYISGTGTIIGRVGEKTRMQCIFSGYPTPNVKWTYQRTPDKVNRFSLKMHNTILEISDTKMTDAGKITCTATNANTNVPKQKSFTLDVQSKPIWKRKPEHLNKAEEEDATFYCEADAKPQAKIEWFINGVPIAKAPANPRRRLENNKITYHDLKKADVGVIQCNASNVHGWMYANAFLNVLADPPSIIQALPDMLKFPDGKTVTIKCDFFGAPQPIISWKKDGRSLTGGRFVPRPDGSLEIQNIQATDAGRYECLASNKFGEERDSVDVFVRRPTKIKVPPADTTVIAGKEAKFTCEAETDPLETANLQITWQKDGQDINYGSTQRISENTWDNSILISGTDALDTGTYTCVASNGLDRATKGARLIVQAPPRPPTNVFVEECRSRSATIRWQPGQDNNAPILNYIIQFNTTFSPWQDSSNDVSSVVTEQDVALSPWGKYKFRVFARNIVGTSLDSEPSVGFCETDSAQPDKNPDNVRTIDESPDKLIIAWSPMPPIEQNGPNMHYSITFVRIDDPNATPNTTRIEDPRVQQLIHTKDVLPYKPYQITVKAINGHGEARQTAKPIVGFSGETFPTQVVNDFRVVQDSIEGTTAVFEWSAVDESVNVTNGFFRGYQIKYWRRSDTKMKFSVYVIQRDIAEETAAYAQYLSSNRKRRAVGDVVQYTVTNLPAYSDVQAHVAVINKHYSGDPSNVIDIRTKQGVPGPPLKLRVAEIGPNHVILEWTPPDEPNGILVGYDVDYVKVVKMTQDTRQQRRPQITNPTATRAKVWNLEHRTKYSIFLAARTIVGKGEEAFVDVTTASPGAPGKPSMKIVGVEDNAINVTWTPSKPPASSFFVQYRKDGSTEWQRSPYESDLSWANVTELDRSYTYEVRVVASNGAGYETESDSEYVFIADNRADSAGMSNVAQSSWFIAMMVIIAVFILIVILACLIRQNRDEKYPVIENDLLRAQPHQDDRSFGVFPRPEEPYRKSQGSLNSDIKPGIDSDNDDSMGAYEDDPTKFNEDGSFVGQYGTKQQLSLDSDTKAESAMSTFV